MSAHSLSFAQQRVWFLDQFEKRAVYNSCKAERIRGNLNVASLERSLQAIIQRHEVLRTTYPVVAGTPVQQIAKHATIPFVLVDLQSWETDKRNSALRRLAAQETQRPFDLAEEYPMRARLLRLTEQEHILLLTLHQIVFDSWSVGILFRELWTGYEAYSRGGQPKFADLLIQYADFAVWQRESLRSEKLTHQLAYWKRQLRNVSTGLNLPTDYLRPAVQSCRGARHSISLSRSLSDAIRQLSRKLRATTFMTLLAAYKTLLFRYSAEEDVTVGCPILNRSLPETEHLIGSFVNLLVLRTQFSHELTFREVVARVRNVCMAAYAHQDVPFEKLVEEIQLRRDLSVSPLFQTMFAFQSTPLVSLSLPDLKAESLEVEGGTAKFDLTFSLAEREQGIAGYVEYSTDLFDHGTIERMINHFQILLEGIVADPDQRIADLPILTEAERHQLLVEWNNTVADYPRDKCLHELFEEQAERIPDAIAVAFEAQQLTYRDLNTRANQLAHYLISLGVRVGSLVGVCVERSPEMVIGLLGVLKAGGAYVPLDPNYPKERLRFMLEDSQVSVLLTQEKLVEDRGWRPAKGMEDGDSRSFILDPRLQVVFLDRDWPVIRAQSPETPDSHRHSDNLAYVIYTSGSTGQPKGVQVSHRSVVNCLHSIEQRLGFTNRDVLLAVTTISFDIAALELFLPLLTGGTVAVASREERADGTGLLRRLTESSATAMQATPSTWRLLLEAGWQGSEAFKIICGGEGLARDLSNELLARGTLWNLYGPAETTIWSAVSRVPCGAKSISIGRPIENTQIYILDCRQKLVPLGVDGEIYIGGDGLARGYLNRPELNAEKFISNPFSGDRGSRLYRTGDRARYLPDGNIEFLGRIDNQVKIRGYRIELREIEATLNQHPGVSECVIVTGDLNSPLEQSLIAYVVPKLQPAPSGAELRGYFKEKLPEYMIPSLFVTLKSLPLTPNGKIDRSALPAPDGTRPDLTPEFVAPRTAVEEIVVQVWREILNLDKIGVHDNFFELGGHSLLATRLVARLRNSLSIDLQLRKLFELPTVAALSHHIDDLLHDQSGTRTPPVVPVPHNGVVPASFSQQRLWFLHELNPESTVYNISSVFSVRGALDVSALEEAVNTVIARHEILRTTFSVVDGTPIQNIHPALTLVLSTTDLEHLPEELKELEARKIALEEARRPFDLGDGPLIRARVLSLGNQNYVVLFNFDHTILDGWSMKTLFNEVGTSYEAFVNRQLLRLPALWVQYADFAVWQRKYLQGGNLEPQLGYWKRQLNDYLPAVNLSTDYPRPAIQTSRGIRKIHALSNKLTDSLKELSRREGVTLFMTLLAAFKILLSRYSGQEDVVVGSTIAGRGRPEIEGLIGFFINALPLRTNLSGNPTFLDLLKRVREVCLGAYTHQDVPFEKIVEAVNPNRHLSLNPLFQVLFNMADVSERVLQLYGCEVTKESFFDPEAKFDITLYAPEKEGAIELAIVYNADLFKDERIAVMLDQLSYLLSQIVEKPELPIGTYSLVSPSVRATLPDPNARLDDSWEGAIHARFSRQAVVIPDRIAVADPNETWTYRELEIRSNQIASYLLTRGIQPKDVVAVFAHRASSLVLALLGILKAGAAFVILDPGYPTSRLISYLRIARPRAWLRLAGAGEVPPALEEFLVELNLCCRLTLFKGRQIPEIDSLADHAVCDSRSMIRADDPAYVAFTSGSTGQPKGVICRHGPITHFLPWQKEAFDLRETDRFCLLSGLAYNHLHRDIFTALYLGATLFIPDPQVVRSPEQLVEWLRQNVITVLHLTPALGQLLLAAGKGTLPAVRRIFFGGDVLTGEEVARIHELAPCAKIGSFYGATETQRAVGYYEIPESLRAEGDDGMRAIPLGRGIKDVQFLVFNCAGQLAGTGELGELYVRSPHLAEGYIEDEKLTEEMFVTNPFTNEPNDRLYRSGELARYLPDGNVEWVGRNDRRVNIRGFRVELAEIEFVLNQHAAVRGCAVVLQAFDGMASEKPELTIHDLKPDLRLVAYVSAEEEGQSFVDLLRSFLSEKLPDYMVPSHFVILDRLPLSPNGKVDYQALPPAQFTKARGEPSDAPQSEIEQKLNAIIAQVLGREKVGVNEDFFRLGGHSLLAAQVAARIREALGVALELRAFLASPTVAGLARQFELSGNGQTPTQSAQDEREEFEI